MTRITSLAQLDLDGTYSYADYLTWCFEESVELIRGKIFRMSPAPKAFHQRISSQMFLLIGEYLKGKPCELFAAPFDVRLFDRRKSVRANKDIFTVVQPDLCVIGDVSKLDERGCLGAPDLVVEILSSGNSKREMRMKYELYQESGVREYWIADPDHETLHQFVLEGEEYRLVRIWVTDEVMACYIFPDFHVDINKIFEKPEWMKRDEDY